MDHKYIVHRGKLRSLSRTLAKKMQKQIQPVFSRRFVTGLLGTDIPSISA